MPLQPSLPFDNLKAHNNTGLFADHFLNTPERLHAMQEWNQAAGIKNAFEQIANLYQQQARRFSERTNESQTEEGFIRPVLNLLWSNTCYQVQVRIPTVNNQRQPDYAFFRSPEARLEADSRLGTMDYWRTVPCLGDAKRWSASLDKKRAADDNPSAQICNYLYRSRVRWGILTNGRIWRLYEREKSSAGGIFYEVNLEELLHHRDPEAVSYTHLRAHET